MRQELAVPKSQAVQPAGEQRAVGVNWIDSRATMPVPVKVLEVPTDPIVERERARQKLWHKLLRPTLSNIILFGCLIGLFGLYCLSCTMRALTLEGNQTSRWEKMRRLSRQFGLALFLAAGLMGCVGYVGPGPVYGGPYIDGPDFHVFGGGYHGHYVGAFSHRGAVSRGFVGHGHR